MFQDLSWIFLSFLFGVVVHSIQPFTPISPLIWSVCLGCFVLVCWSVRKRPVLSTCAYLACALLLGAWRFDVSIPRVSDGIISFQDRNVQYSGIVLNVHHQLKHSIVTVKVKSAEGVRIQGIGAIVSVKTKNVTSIEGDEVIFTCKTRSLEASPYTIVRRRLLARRGIWNECVGVTQVDLRAPPSRFNLSAQLSATRHATTRKIHTIFPRDEAELIAGILYGDQELGEEVKADIQRAGLMHLVAVSGSNVTIVVIVVSIILLALGCTRRQAFIATSTILIIFVLFVGASASVMRAGMMGWLILLARELGRKGWSDRILLVTAVVLVFSNPWVLCFDVGFALSFLAMWGLLTWAPAIEKKCSFLSTMFGFRSTVATTIGATLMTAPYLAWIFGRVTLAGLVTNILALPLVSWTMLWGVIALVVPYCFWPALGLARAIIYIAQLSRLMPWLDVHIRGMDIWFLIVSYLLIWRLWCIFTRNDTVDSVVDDERQ